MNQSQTPLEFIMGHRGQTARSKEGGEGCKMEAADTGTLAASMQRYNAPGAAAKPSKTEHESGLVRRFTAARPLGMFWRPFVRIDLTSSSGFSRQQSSKTIIRLSRSRCSSRDRSTKSRGRQNRLASSLSVMAGLSTGTMKFSPSISNPCPVHHTRIKLAPYLYVYVHDDGDRG